MTTITALELAKDLLAIPSVSPQDLGCQDILKRHLNNLGFNCETMIIGPPDQAVTNLWAFKAGSQPNSKTLLYAGHTDVVPTGPVDQWISPPFTPTILDGKLYARGSSDMKTANAIFIAALQTFLANNPNHNNSIALLITSDEEGDAIYGTDAVCDILAERGIGANWCIIGEASADKQLGDMVKNGRRGSMNGSLTIKGIQGHIAYPQLARNPIHQALAALDELAKTQWDQGDKFFSPTSFQISNLISGTGATNVIPSDLKAEFNFRFSPQRTAQDLQQQVQEILQRHQLEFDLQWSISGNSFISRQGALLTAVQQVIKQTLGIDTVLSTTGGTSDGRFIIKICPEIVEVGPPNNTIHKINEYIALNDIIGLEKIYLGLLESLVK